MKPILGVLAALCLLAGCAADRGAPASQKQSVVADAPDPSPETYALGSTVTADGSIPKDATIDTFGRGHQVFLSVDASGAHTDQTIEVNWYDAAGRLLLKEARHVPIGAGYAPFAAGGGVTAMPGRHRAVIVINGRQVSEKPFNVL